MKSLLILGDGGYGQLVKEIAEILGYRKISFLDDNLPIAIGKLNDIDVLQDSYDETIVAIGNPLVRSQNLLKLKNPTTLIHPSAVISKSAEVKKGVVIEANCVVSASAKVYEGSFICAGAVVNHNAVVNKCCQIDCNAVVSAFSKVPDGKKVASCEVWKNT